MNNVLMALGLTLFAGMATGIGSLIAFTAKRTNHRFLTVSTGFSAGVMLYVSFIEIFPKGLAEMIACQGDRRGYLYTTLGFFGGMLLIGLIALTFGLFEGTAADWLPLALVDGRGLSNQLGSVMLSLFFASIMAVRIVGSWLIERFGRVAVLRSSALLAAVGAVTTILVPGHTGAVIGVVAWASYPTMPRGIVWPALWYLGSGAGVMVLAGSAEALSPVLCGGPLVVGHLAIAWVLYREGGMRA